MNTCTNTPRQNTSIHIGNYTNTPIQNVNQYTLTKTYTYTSIRIYTYKNAHV